MKIVQNQKENKTMEIKIQRKMKNKTKEIKIQRKMKKDEFFQYKENDDPNVFEKDQNGTNHRTRMNIEKTQKKEEASKKEASKKEAAEKEATEKEAAEKEAAEKEASKKEAVEREVAKKLASEKEAVEKEAAEKEESEKKAAEREAVEKEAAERGENSENWFVKIYLRIKDKIISHKIKISLMLKFEELIPKCVQKFNKELENEGSKYRLEDNWCNYKIYKRNCPLEYEAFEGSKNVFDAIYTLKDKDLSLIYIEKDLVEIKERGKCCTNSCVIM